MTPEIFLKLLEDIESHTRATSLNSPILDNFHTVWYIIDTLIGEIGKVDEPFKRWLRNVHSKLPANGLLNPYH